MSHTPEPWAVSDSPYGAIISTASRELRQSWCVSTEDTGRKYSAEIAVANARRIVACVNACEGIPIEWLESNGAYAIPVPAMREPEFNERDTYRELCGELLKCLVDAQNTLAHCKAGVGYAHRQTDTAIKLNAAITKAEKVLGGDK